MILIFLQFAGIKPRIDACNIIITIIRIMDINDIGSAILKIINLIMSYRHIVREIPALIMKFAEGTIRITVVIRNRNDINVAVRICVCCPPYALQ